MINLGTIKTPVGFLEIKSDQGKLTGVDIIPATGRRNERLTSEPLACKAREQFKKYFLNADYHFDLPLDIQGTDFQKRVWKIMVSIPRGKVMTYGEVAKKLGSSPRAVGNACRANPLPIIIPCHRIVSQSGLGGFGGHRNGEVVAIKDWLLQHEGVMLS